MNISKERAIEYDVLRIIAIFSVVMIHCTSYYVNKFPTYSLEFVFANIMDSISRIGVPFFLFISGAFMLDETKLLPINKIKTKIIKLCFILVFWSLIYAIYFNFKNIFNFTHYHLWYLFVITGLYIATPILRLFVKRENINYVVYFIILAAIFQLLSVTTDLFPFMHIKFTKYVLNMFQLSFVSGFTIYYLSGWLIKNFSENLNRHKLILFLTFSINLLLIILGAQFLTKPYFRAYNYFYNYLGIFVFLYSFSFFIILKNLIVKFKNVFSEKIKNFIFLLSNLSFGVYLVHVIFLNTIEKHINSLSINFIIKIIVCYFVSLLISYLSCYLLSKIKYVKECIKV